MTEDTRQPTDQDGEVVPVPAWPRMRTYVFVLPDPLWLPDGYTTVRGRPGLFLSRAADLLPMLDPPPDAMQPAHVSLTVHRIPGRDALRGPLLALDQVVRASAATFGIAIPAMDSDAAVEPGTTVPLAEAEGEPPSASWWTVVEATLLDPGPHALWDMTATDRTKPDLVTFATWALLDLVRGYRLATGELIADATYRRLCPLVATWSAALDGSDFVGPDRIWLEHAVERFVPAPITTDESMLRQIEHVVWRLEHDDPLLVYADRMNAAYRAAAVDGDFDVAVLHAAVAAESLLVTTWLALEWERGTDPNKVAQQWARLAGRVLPVVAWLGQLLGGDWSDRGCAPVSAWRADLVEVRNRVAHLGERPSRGQVEAALDVGPALSALLKERVAGVFPRFSRTAFFLLGTDELTARISSRWDRVRAQLDQGPLSYAAFATWRADVLARAETHR